MRVQLVERSLKPKGVPMALKIESRTFEGEAAVDILEQIREYFASDVIPRIPFLRLDEPYRKQIRGMGTVELSRMLVQYINDQEGKSFPLPETDEEALDIMWQMDFLTIEQTS